MSGEFAVWVYLSRTPLLWLTVTLAAYLVADRIAAATGRHPVANPVLIAIVLTGAVLTLTGTPYATYFQGAQFVHFLLGPATVVLALPLYEHRATVMRALVPMFVALGVGCVVALSSAIGFAYLLGHPARGDRVSKSEVGDCWRRHGRLRGARRRPNSHGCYRHADGIIGAILVTPLMNLMGVTDMRARGFAAGLAAHGIGTARAFQVSEVAGTFAGIAMGLNAFLTAILVPIAVGLLP